MEIQINNTITLSRSEFDNLINENMAYIYKYAMSLTSDHDEAMDLLQDTFLQAFRKRDRYKEDKNFKGWVMTIMRNLFINRYHKLLRFPQHAQTDKSLYFINKSGKVMNSGLENMTYDDVYKHIEALDDKYRSSFLMYYNGFKYTEISERMNIPIGTVKNRIHKARKLLKHQIRMQEGQWEAA